MGLSAVLFDLDDTLIDRSAEERHWPDYTEPHMRLVAHRLRQVCPDLDESAFTETIASVRTRMWAQPVAAPTLAGLLSEVLGRLGIPASGDLIEDLLRAYDWQPMSGVVPFPDARTTLETLRSAGMALGLVTNSSEPRWMRDIELRAYGLLDFFPRCRVCSSDVGFLKPHPSMFTTALEALGVRPQDAVFVGDNAALDVRGARGVGMRAVLFQPYPDLDGGRTAGIGREGSDVAVISRLADLPSILDSWFPGWRS